MPLTLTIALTIVTVFGSVFAHHEALRALAVVARHRRLRGRIALFATMSGLLIVHICEIALFATAFYLAVQRLGLGSFVNPRSMSLLDYFYYAAETYSTLGYGDIYPLGAVRLMASITPLTGLLLLGWSSAFLFSLVHSELADSGR